MDIQEFLKNKLENFNNYSLTEKDQELIDKDIAKFIYQKLTSKKFRRWALDETTQQRVHKAIQIAVKNNQPLKVIFPQGGYKLWRFDSFPEVDWAEFFNISHILNYMATITAGYEYGVDLYYYMHTLVPEVHDNLKTEDIDSYVASFESLLEQFRKYLPNNLTVQISKDADFYDSRKEYFEILESNLENGKQDFENSSPEKQKGYLKTSKMNIKWDGKEDLTSLTEKEKSYRIKKGAYYEKALSYLKKPAKFTKADDKVLVFIKSGGGWLGVGSTKNSIAKYWVGTGIIEKINHNNSYKFRGRILTPSQFEQVKESIRYQKINLIPGKNFETIGIIDGELNFVHKK